MALPREKTPSDIRGKVKRHTHTIRKSVSERGKERERESKHEFCTQAGSEKRELRKTSNPSCLLSFSFNEGRVKGT
jgi:hypothetical protein